MRAVPLNLSTWVNIQRPRKYIFLVHRDIGEAEELVVAATQLAAWMEQSRGQEPPQGCRCFARSPSDRRWPNDVLTPLSQCNPAQRRANGGGPPERSWQREWEALREAWEEAGHTGWDAHPLQHAALWGIPSGQIVRVREILEVFLLSAAFLAGVAPEDQAAMEGVRQDLHCNFSQNPSWNNLHKPWTVGTLCTSTRLYNYAQDRVWLPSEAMRAHGWDADGCGPNVEGLSISEGWDLVGECMALQSAGLAIWSLLLVCGARLPELWA